MTREEVFDLIKDAGYCVLATISENKPKARPMMPLLTDEGKMLLACLSSCRTIGQIQENPNVELCYIDRKMRFARISGQAHCSEDKDKKEHVWTGIPMLRQYFTGPDDANFILIEIDIEKAEIMTPQQQTPEKVSLSN